MELPLHPIIIHLPIGLTILLPIIVLVTWALFIKGHVNKFALVLLPVLYFSISGLAYIAMETGEDEEHTVEKVVDEKYIEEHEESAETFFVASLVVAAISLAPLFITKTATIKAGFPLLLAAHGVLIYFVYLVGHSGGELVYKYNAPSAYQDSKD